MLGMSINVNNLKYLYDILKLITDVCIPRQHAVNEYSLTGKLSSPNIYTLLQMWETECCL